MSYTKGEWNRTDIDWEGQPIISCQGKTIAVAFCGDDDSPVFDEAVKNANLISASPDLLEACEIALKSYLDMFEEKATQGSIDCEFGVSDWESFMPKEYYVLQQAINKARGL